MAGSLCGHSLAEKGHIFQGVCYVTGEGFLPVARVAGEAVIKTLQQKEAALPLLDFIHNEQDRDVPYTVAVNDIPSFVEKNSPALRHPANIIDAHLLDMQLSDVPDCIRIFSCNEDEGKIRIHFAFMLHDSLITIKDIAGAIQKHYDCLPGKALAEIE